MHIYLFVYNIIEEEGARNLKGGKRVMGELEKGKKTEGNDGIIF